MKRRTALAVLGIVALTIGIFELGVFYSNSTYPIKADGKFHVIRCGSGYELRYQIIPTKGFFLWFEGKPIHDAANLTSYDTYGIIVSTYDSGRTHEIAVVCP